MVIPKSLPTGYFFEGYLGRKLGQFPTLTIKINWREIQLKKFVLILNHNLTLTVKNVIGRPNGNTEWFAKNLGFTKLGENHSEVLELDQQKFKNKFIDLSQAYDKLIQEFV